MKLVKQKTQEPPCLIKYQFPYVMTFTKEESDRLWYSSEMLEWGKENIGQFIQTWAVYAPQKKVVKAYFFSKEHAMLFALRWL